MGLPFIPKDLNAKPKNHDFQFCEKRSLSQGFSFHPKLGEWLQGYHLFETDEILSVYELKCDDNSCPVQETLFVGSSHCLQIGKEKSQISKIDLRFAYERQIEKKSLS